ncbi:hypothetical protein L208DRAFT_1384873 [Tricholoma matsutake]|nr:hypothetical protein L208DRAFT_1384873 [Tricholoma matsutake 945]
MELKSEAWVPLPALSLEAQLSKLLVRGPVVNVNSAGPNLIIIDGLDECASQEGIRRLIDWLRRNNPPFRFLLTSLPEPQIEACFRPGDGCTDVLLPSLTDSKDDIRKFFVKELEKIKRERLSSQGLSDWPPKSSVHELVEKSEGLFVYAATAVRYISGEGNPKKRLADVLELRKGLDSLYTQVIGEARKWDYCDILSMVLLTYDNSLEGDGIRFALDFLTNQSWSNTLFYAPAMSHGQLMIGCLGAITRSSSDGSDVPTYALISWHHHASLFLSALGANEGLGGLKDEAEELVKKIDLKWVKVWLVQALGESTQKKLHGLAKRDGAQVLERKLRSISGILEKVSLSCDHFLKHNC